MVQEKMSKMFFGPFSMTNWSTYINKKNQHLDRKQQSWFLLIYIQTSEFWQLLGGSSAFQRPGDDGEN